jgi:hypothetical protein
LTRGGIPLRFLAFAAHLRIGLHFLALFAAPLRIGRRLLEHSRTLGRTGPLNIQALVIPGSAEVDSLVRRWHQRRQRRRR